MVETPPGCCRGSDGAAHRGDAKYGANPRLTSNADHPADHIGLMDTTLERCLAHDRDLFVPIASCSYTAAP